MLENRDSNYQINFWLNKPSKIILTQLNKAYLYFNAVEKFYLLNKLNQRDRNLVFSATEILTEVKYLKMCKVML